MEEKKCACKHCKCTTKDITDGVSRGGKWYCSEACAKGHKTEECCGHKSCNCSSR